MRDAKHRMVPHMFDVFFLCSAVECTLIKWLQTSQIKQNDKEGISLLSVGRQYLQVSVVLYERYLYTCCSCGAGMGGYLTYEGTCPLQLICPTSREAICPSQPLTVAYQINCICVKTTIKYQLGSNVIQSTERINEENTLPVHSFDQDVCIIYYC